jgi:hypothetical protein
VLILRRIGGLVLVAVGVAASLVGAAGWVIGDHRADDGSFVAELAPIHTDGYAISVPDVSAVAARHGVGRLLTASLLSGDARVMVTVRADSPVLVALVPSLEASRYLADVGHTEVVGVGYSSGVQPVQTRLVPGLHPPVAVPRTWPWVVVTADRSLEFELPAAEPMALVLLRSDEGLAFTATVTAAIRPSSWGLSTTLLLVFGGACLLVGAALLFARRQSAIDQTREAQTGQAQTGQAQTGQAWTAELFAADIGNSSRRVDRFGYGDWRDRDRNWAAVRDRPARSPYVDTAT